MCGEVRFFETSLSEGRRWFRGNKVKEWFSRKKSRDTHLFERRQ